MVEALRTIADLIVIAVCGTYLVSMYWHKE